LTENQEILIKISP